MGTERKGARSSVPPPSDLMWDPLRDGSHVSLLLWCPTATLKRGGETRKKWVSEFPGIPCHLICRPDAPLPPLMWLPRPQRPPECAAPLISRPKTNIRRFGIQHSNYRKRTHGATGEPHEPDVDTLCLCLLSCWHGSRFLSAAFCDLLRKKEKTRWRTLKILNICWKSNRAEFHRLRSKDSFTDALYSIKALLVLTGYCWAGNGSQSMLRMVSCNAHPVITILFYSFITSWVLIVACLILRAAHGDGKNPQNISMICILSESFLEVW